MDQIFWWIGALHLAAYAVASLTLAAGWFAEWLIKRWHLKAEMVRAYLRVLKDRADAKEKDRIVG